ncbi:MAG: hypothetical protein V8R14_01070 [Clostridia bacterium]
MIFDCVMPTFKELLVLLLIGVFGGFGQIADLRIQAGNRGRSAFTTIAACCCQSWDMFSSRRCWTSASVIGCALVIIAALIYIFSGKKTTLTAVKAMGNVTSEYETRSCSLFITDPTQNRETRHMRQSRL